MPSRLGQGRPIWIPRVQAVAVGGVGAPDSVPGYSTGAPGITIPEGGPSLAWDDSGVAPPAIKVALLALIERSRRVAIETAERTESPLTENVALLTVQFPDPDSDDWETRDETVRRSCMANSLMSARLLESVIEATDNERLILAEQLSIQYGQDVFVGAPWEVSTFDREPIRWIESRLIDSLVSEYLHGLGDLSEPDPSFAVRLIADLLKLLDTHRFQVVASTVLGGLLASDPITVGNVLLRPLKPGEIGDIIAPFGACTRPHDLNTVQPSLAFWVPRHVLQAELEADMEDLRVGLGGAGLREVVLALQLLGFDPSGVGTYREGPRYRWLFGVRGAPLLVRSGPVTPRRITPADLEEAISLTKAFPQGAVDPPSSTQTFALHRFALGCCRQNAVDSVVDFVVCMEAALLGGEQGEPTFRFAANGAAYLRPPGTGRREVYDEFRKLYDARSRAVHGRRFPTAGELQPASARGRMFAQEILLKALREGWPTPEMLVESLMGAASHDESADASKSGP